MWSVQRTLISGMAFAAAMAAAGGASAQMNLVERLQPAANALEQFKWKKRPVLLFADSDMDDNFQAALRNLTAAKTLLRERDMVVLTDTDPSRKTEVRAALKPEGFAMYLIGKDGGLKLSSTEVITPETLFETIDAMPMRQREMRTD